MGAFFCAICIVKIEEIQELRIWKIGDAVNVKFEVREEVSKCTRCTKNFFDT